MFCIIFYFSCRVWPGIEERIVICIFIRLNVATASCRRLALQPRRNQVADNTCACKEEQDPGLEVMTSSLSARQRVPTREEPDGVLHPSFSFSRMEHPHPGLEHLLSAEGEGEGEQGTELSPAFHACGMFGLENSFAPIAPAWK